MSLLLIGIRQLPLLKLEDLVIEETIIESKISGVTVSKSFTSFSPVIVLIGMLVFLPLFLSLSQK